VDDLVNLIKKTVAASHFSCHHTALAEETQLLNKFAEKSSSN
jgi:hypothetical protein